MINKIYIDIWLMVMLFVGCSGTPSISVLPLLDTFQQQGNIVKVKMDILWVIDNSNSMKNEQKALRENFNSFITSFIGKGYDYRIAVITTDAYYTETGKYTTPGAEDDLHPLLKVQTGPYTDFAIKYNFPSGTTNPYYRYVTSGFVDGDLTKHYCIDNFFDGCLGETDDREDINGYKLSGYNLIDSSNTNIDFTEYEPSSSVYEIGHEDYISNNIRNIFAINSNVGIRGFGAESGLRSVEAALNNEDNKALNFPRLDAHLAVIVVSDEEDQILNAISGERERNSKNNSETGETTTDYYHKVLSKGVPTYGYSFHVIARLKENSCVKDDTDDSYNISNGVGLNYIELSKRSGGVQASICKDFANSLSDIAQTIIEKTVEFPLTSIPLDLSKLRVSVKNPGETTQAMLPQNIENGWTYNPFANSIVFHGTSVPAQGSEINILYELDGL